MNEKRRCHRINMELPVCYKLLDVNRNLSIATILDISATGLCLLTRDQLEVGQELPLQVTLPGDERIVVNVKVIWIQEMHTSMTSEYRVGVKVMEPMKADEAKFVRFYAGQLNHFFKKNPQ